MSGQAACFPLCFSSWNKVLLDWHSQTNSHFKTKNSARRRLEDISLETKLSLYTNGDTNNQSEEQSMWHNSVTTSLKSTNSPAKMSCGEVTVVGICHNPSPGAGSSSWSTSATAILIVWSSGPSALLNRSSPKTHLTLGLFLILQTTSWIESTSDPYVKWMHLWSD